MLGKHIFFIVNATANGGKTKLWWEKQLPDLVSCGICFAWEYTKAAGTAGDQVRVAVEERGADVIIAVGGDGTLFEVVNGLAPGGKPLRSDLILGVMRTGSGSDFCRTAHSDGEISITELLFSCVPRPIDLCCCDLQTNDGEKSFCYINSFDAGAGADTCVAVNKNAGLIKRIFKNGKVVFLLSALRILLTYGYTKTEVATEEERFSGEYIIIGVGNGRYAGGGMMLFPHADLSDGKLDLLLVKRRSKMEIFRVFRYVYDGSFLRERDVLYRQVREVHIHTERPIAVELDGEVPGCTDVKIRVLPQAIQLLQRN